MEEEHINALGSIHSPALKKNRLVGVESIKERWRLGKGRKTEKTNENEKANEGDEYNHERVAYGLEGVHSHV
jgi:hypothetical protein